MRKPGTVAILKRPEAVAEIVRLRRSGMTYVQIGEAIGTTPSTVFGVLVREESQRRSFCYDDGPSLLGWDIRRSLGMVRHHVPGGAPRTRSEKHETILRLRRTGLTMEAIGARVGLTRERVRQVLVREERVLGETLTGWLSCEKCGKHRTSDHVCKHPRPVERTCKRCSSAYSDDPRSFYCPTCRYDTKPCGHCGAQVTRKTSSLHRRSKLRFCDRDCLGSYIAARHGFRVHPENARAGWRRRNDRT